jgi:hypothetical protein
MKRAPADRGQGRKPYGFYAGEAAVIERMRALQAAGMSYERIAGQLNEAGVRPRSGGRWWGKTVNNIVGAGVAPTAALSTDLRQVNTDLGQVNTADLMLEMMRELEPGEKAPVSIHELRMALPGVEHDEFDRVALQLRKERRVFLSRHDFPQGERPEVRRRLVRDGERYFIAITVRGPD